MLASESLDKGLVIKILIIVLIIIVLWECRRCRAILSSTGWVGNQYHHLRITSDSIGLSCGHHVPIHYSAASPYSTNGR